MHTADVQVSWNRNLHSAPCLPCTQNYHPAVTHIPTLKLHRPKPLTALILKFESCLSIHRAMRRNTCQEREFIVTSIKAWSKSPSDWYEIEHCFTCIMQGTSVTQLRNANCIADAHTFREVILAKGILLCWHLRCKVFLVWLDQIWLNLSRNCARMGVLTQHQADVSRVIL